MSLPDSWVGEWTWAVTGLVQERPGPLFWLAQGLVVAGETVLQTWLSAMGDGVSWDAEG